MKIHHIGYLNKHIETSKEAFVKLGYKSDTSICEDYIRKIKIIFMKNEEYRIELVQPLNKESPLYELLKRYKNTPYHFCYETSDLESQVHKMCRDGYVIIQESEIAPCLQNRLVTFLMGPDMGIVELLQE